MDNDLPMTHPGQPLSSEMFNNVIDRVNRANTHVQSSGLSGRFSQDYSASAPLKQILPQFAHIIADTFPQSSPNASSNLPNGLPNAYLMTWDPFTQDFQEDPNAACNVVPIFGVQLHAGDEIAVVWSQNLEAFVPVNNSGGSAAAFSGSMIQSIVGQNIPNNALTVVTFTSGNAVYDTDGYCATANQFTVPKTGYYTGFICGGYAANAAATGTGEIDIYPSNNNITADRQDFGTQTATGPGMLLNCSFQCHLTAGDNVQFKALQSTSGSQVFDIIEAAIQFLGS